MLIPSAHALPASSMSFCEDEERDISRHCTPTGSAAVGSPLHPAHGTGAAARFRTIPCPTPATEDSEKRIAQGFVQAILRFGGGWWRLRSVEWLIRDAQAQVMGMEKSKSIGGWRLFVFSGWSVTGPRRPLSATLGGNDDPCRRAVRKQTLRQLHVVPEIIKPYAVGSEYHRKGPRCC